MYDYYFTRNIAASQRFVTFNWAHILYLVFIVAFILIATKYLKKKSTEDRWRILACASWVMPIIYIFRLILFIILDRDLHISILQNRLPLEICDLSMFLIPFALNKRNKIVLNYLYAIGMVGAIISNLTPNLGYYGQYANFSWQVSWYFIAHGLIVAFILLPITAGIWRPDYRTIPKFFGYFLLYCTIVYPINWLLDSNYVYINKPATGTPTMLFAEWMGPHLFVIPLMFLFLFVVALFYLPWFVIEQRNAKRISE